MPVIYTFYKVIELVYSAPRRLRTARKRHELKEVRTDIELIQARDTLAQLQANQARQQFVLEEVEIREPPEVGNRG